MTNKDVGTRLKGAVLGGFRRRDVIAYIESLQREYREEIEACRAGADLLRRERDEARAAAVRFQTQWKELSDKHAGQQAFEAELARAREREQELTEAQSRLETEIGAVRKVLAERELSRQQQETELQGLRAHLEKFTVSYARAEMLEQDAARRAGEVERAARARAEEIERGARMRAEGAVQGAAREAEQVREVVRRLRQETITRYAALRQEEAHLSQTVGAEIVRIREMMARVDGLFEGLAARLEVLTAPTEERPEAPAAQTD
jgi:chromosome segregation ATPase